MTKDPTHGLTVGNSDRIPQILPSEPDGHEVLKALNSMILSASGWRKVFAVSGNEEDMTEEISPVDCVLAGLIGISFADFLIPRLGEAPENITIAIGLDSRPTGPMLAEAFMRPLVKRGFSIRYVFIAAAPELMSYTKNDENIHAFAYISASHNPIGHNGFKFGLSTGGVLDAKSAGELGEIFLSHCENSGSRNQAYNALTENLSEQLDEIFESVDVYKPASLASYREFSEIVLADSFLEAIVHNRLDELRTAVGKIKPGIIAELNGSARCLTIDEEFFTDLGAQIQVANGIPRQISHRIVPEGRSLNECKMLLEKAHGENPSYILGYVPDNDGDRGNIVYINRHGSAEILQAQTVFALVALAESAWLEYSSGGKVDKAAIAINGPTSMRIDEIAAAFGMEVFRAEVGEANVVGLANTLRDRGYTVRLMGEGSNGGNITHPAAVRDPLNTIASILKLLALRGDSGKPGLYEIWCAHRGNEYRADFTLADVIDSLPAYITTSAYEDRALMKISTTDHKKLKAAYENILVDEIAEFISHNLADFDISSWEEINTEGSNEAPGFGPEFRSGAEKGGLKILFRDEANIPQAYMWMRGSGTEPVFRVLVDVKGERSDLEQLLLNWHRSLIERADSEILA